MDKVDIGGLSPGLDDVAAEIERMDVQPYRRKNLSLKIEPT
jgi:hypothetical protein